MKLSSLTPADLSRRLCGDGLLLRTGPFNFRITSSIASVAAGLRLLYADYPLACDEDFIDFNVSLQCSGGLRRWWRRQVILSYDGANPFVPLPLDHAFPLLEWAMNWCVSTQAHHVLTLHAAVLERAGRAVILPAPPGSGKSTLCAGLASRNWRLLSDELALLSLTDGSVIPLGRPISLKNESLRVIREFVPDAVLNTVTHDTSKGSVSHMKVPSAQLQRLDETARPRWVVFPKYTAGAAAELRPRSKADSMMELGRNAFNYNLLGLTGFELLADVVDACECYDFSYSRLEDAVVVFDRLLAEAGA